jgi:carbon monoxide dehydrogenase subunit G
MRITGSRVLPSGQEQTYALLHDPDTLARCIPGCEALLRTGDHEYRMKMKLAIASTNGLFDGTVRLVEHNPVESFRMIVEGAGRIGFMKGDGAIRLAPADDGTEVQYDGEVHIGGSIAGVGQRLLDTTSKMLIKRFFNSLCDQAAARAAS